MSNKIIMLEGQIAKVEREFLEASLKNDFYKSSILAAKGALLREELRREKEREQEVSNTPIR